MRIYVDLQPELTSFTAQRLWMFWRHRQTMLNSADPLDIRSIIFSATLLVRSYMYSRIFLFIILLATINVAAQQSGCTTMDLPINVIKASGEAIQGLSASDFAVQVRKQSLLVESANYESAPRRILLVIDTTKKLVPDARKLEVEFASGIVSGAQPEDTFALLTARGITQEVKFGADRSELMKALKVLNDSAAESGDAGKQVGPLDAVAKGIGWFGEPRLGDSIVLMAADLDDNHKANPRGVAKLLSDHHIRLFGVALGRLPLTNSTTALFPSYGVPLIMNTGDPNFLSLTVNSGGYVAPENTKAINMEFQLTEPKKQQLQKTGALMAQLIDTFYDVRVKASTISHEEAATVNFNADKMGAMPGTHVLFPHEVSPCSSAVATR